MYYRKVSEKLLEWKEKYSGKYAALLQGARRVGKSTIAENFAKENYQSYILIDFSNISKNLQEVFEDITDLDIFFLRLQSVTSIKLYERKSVIIFDEIQFAPKVRQAIKFLVKDGRYDYIETGSLINIKKNVKDILIPSEEMKINVYPMDFEEFCLAINRDCSFYDNILEINKPIGQMVNRKLMRDFRTYMAVGGMPQAVEAYNDKKSFQEIDFIKREIIELYKSDLMKIDPSGRISAIYEAIPGLLAIGKKKFSLSIILKKKTTTKDKELLYDLIDSRIVLPCYNVTDPSISLASTKDIDSYKLYLSDIGLFSSMIFNDKDIVQDNIYSKLLSDKLDANLGYLYENVVAQIISSTDRSLYYHIWKDENETHLHEVDFLVTDGVKIIPIEVKSDNVNNHKSINVFSKKYSSRISRRVLFSQKDLGNDGMLEFKPLYLLPTFLKKLK